MIGHRQINTQEEMVMCKGGFRIRRLITSVCFAMVLVVLPCGSWAQTAKSDPDFARYRQAIQKEYGIDIRNFKEALHGGRADGQKITKYDLQQLLMGIKVELEHTSNKMRALEISMDHLEEFPDYYTRLEKMEGEAEKDHGKK